MRYKAKAIKTTYWRPGDDYLEIILVSLRGKLKDGDIVIISEKAISTAKGNLVDESKAQPGITAKLIARFWMRFIWGYFLGVICHMKPESISHLRNYPVKEGSLHKQVALRQMGLLQALKYGSEGGIDISNVPYAYACFPLNNPEDEAVEIHNEILKKLGKKVVVIIADTDSTFTFRCLHFTARPGPIRGIKSSGGFFAYVLGRALKLKVRATPLALTDHNLSVETALDLAELAHHVRGYGAGRTVWDVARKFNVDLSEVTWEMLEEVDHYPIVLIRRKGLGQRLR